jgi:predicted enzyme related to lactoylglutathione lyase
MSDTPSPGIARIGQISVNVRDLERAVAFYRDVLGLTLLFQVPRMAFFRCGDVTLMLALPDAAEFDHPASIIYYEVPDIRASYAALTARGASFRRSPEPVHRAADHDLWMAFLQDTEGNTLALMARTAPA